MGNIDRQVTHTQCDCGNCHNDEAVCHSCGCKHEHCRCGHNTGELVYMVSENMPVPDGPSARSLAVASGAVAR